MYNVIYIHTHDSGRFFSPYGYNMPTPNIMEFARDSLLFRNAHCAGPTCSPSRAALLTGMAPHSSGMLGLAHRGFQMSDYSLHLSDFLRRNGFHTVLSGIQHEAPKNSMLSYDEIIGNTDYQMDRVFEDMTKFDFDNAESVSDFIINYSEEKPFFLSFGMFSTHRLYPDSTGIVDSKYVCVPFPIADNAQNRKDMADYIASVKVADDCFGTVLKALKSSGKYDNTIIIFTTDHGIAMPFMKCNLYDTGTGVALMLRIPDSASNGEVTDSLVSQIDVFPTLCDLLNLPKPQNLQGKSLMPIIKNPENEVNSEIFSEVTYHAAYEPQRCIRTDRYKLIRKYDFHNKHVPANIDACPPKAYLIECGLLNSVRDREQLFDLALDPAERVNLISNPAYSNIYCELSSKLEAHMTETNDPLIDVLHRVPAPNGAKINCLSCVEPQNNEFEP